MELMNIFKVMIIMQLFFAIAITLIAHYLPSDVANQLNTFQDLSNRVDIQNSTSLIQQNLERQKNIPVYDMGALIFYSGNILLDLLLNFVFAIPEMIGLVINGIGNMFGGIDIFIIGSIEIFFSVAFLAWYVISLLQLVTGMRSGKVV